MGIYIVNKTLFCGNEAGGALRVTASDYSFGIFKLFNSTDHQFICYGRIFLKHGKHLHMTKSLH
jgi:hypothetical protein